MAEPQTEQRLIWMDLEMTGLEPDRDSIREKIKDKDVRTGALKDPRIRAEYERLRAERAAEKAENAAKAAEGAEETAIAF